MCIFIIKYQIFFILQLQYFDQLAYFNLKYLENFDHFGYFYKLEFFKYHIRNIYLLVYRTVFSCSKVPDEGARRAKFADGFPASRK